MSAIVPLDERARAVAGSASTVQIFDDDGRPRKAADVLLDIGREHELFHGPDGTAYARLGAAVYAVASTEYREILASAYLDLTDKGAGRNAINDAVVTLSSLAKFKGNRRDVGIRVAQNGGDVVIDLGRADWRMIEVRPVGWRWSPNPPMFRRSPAMGELPEPKEGDICRLWKYVNVAGPQRVLVAAWLLSALRPSGPYPILFLNGEQGTGKSTAARALRRIVDPSASLLRAPPRDVRDLLVGALNGWVLALDNLSFLGAQLSDAMCRISTGGAISERALYSNTDEVLVEVTRPIIVNGIEDLATRPDLVERGLHIELDRIENRRAEGEFWREFEADAPYIFGGLLAGLAAALRDLEGVVIKKLPRMADFAKFSAAGIESLGFGRDEFLAAYELNLDTGMSAAIESSPVGNELLKFMLRRSEWAGTATDLLAELNAETNDSATRSSSWPKSARGLSGVLIRLAPAMRSRGIDVDYGRTAMARTIRMSKRPERPSSASRASSEPHRSDANDADDAASHDLNGDVDWEMAI